MVRKPVQVQHLEDLGIYLVYAENRFKNASMLYLNGELISNTDGWVEVRTLEGLTQKESRASTPAVYKNPFGDVLTREEYNTKRTELETKAFYDEEDDDDEAGCRVVVDRDAYEELKLLDKWTYCAPIMEDVHVTPTFKTVVGHFHSKCVFLRNCLADGDLGKATLWVYDRNKAVEAIIKKCMEHLSVERLPTTDSCISRNVPEEKKQYRFYRNNHETLLSGLKWFSAWGSSIFYDWGWALGFDHGRGQQNPVGTEEQMLALYEADKKALVDKITFEYRKKWEPVMVGANQAAEILALVKSAQSSLAGVRERRDSKGSTSSARSQLSQAASLLEACIRG